MGGTKVSDSKSEWRMAMILGIVMIVALTLKVKAHLAYKRNLSNIMEVIVFEDKFNQPDGLVTNEYAYQHPDDPQALFSEHWTVTSGSLFIQNQAAWTGNLDSCSPNPLSSNCTNSNVFRLRSKQEFRGNIDISFLLRQNGNMDSTQDWYGTHVLLRYKNPYDFYSLSVNRADRKIVIKRKVPCGPSNQGTYFNLSSFTPHNWSPDVWNKYTVSVRRAPSGGVWLGIYDSGLNPPELLVSGVDNGGINENWTPTCQTEGAYPTKQYPPITGYGKVGIRGDFANFSLDDFRVSLEASNFAYLPYISN